MDESNNNNNNNNSLENNNNDKNITPYWVDNLEDVENLLKDIEHNIGSLDESHKARLLFRFGDDDSSGKFFFLLRQIRSKTTL